MNATSARRLPSFAFAAVFTLAMLVGVNTLATPQAGVPQMAKATATAQS